MEHSSLVLLLSNKPNRLETQLSKPCVWKRGNSYQHCGQSSGEPSLWDFALHLYPCLTLLTGPKPSSITILSSVFYQKPKGLYNPNVSELQVPWQPSQVHSMRWALRVAACNLEPLFIALHPVSSAFPPRYLTWFALSQFWPHSEGLIPWFFTQLTFSQC